MVQKRKKVLFISQYFYPELFRGNDIAFDLAKRGVDITVVTGIPNYPQGKFYDGYGLFHKRREIIDGVKVVRVPIIPRGNNVLMLFLNYFSYAISASLFIVFHCVRNCYDACFVQQLSPVMMALPAIVYKKIKHIPIYTWVLDLWPESLQSAGGITNKFVLSFFNKIVKCVYCNSDKILMSSKGFEESILNKGNYKDKLIYYPNWAEDVFSGSTKVAIPALPQGFKVMFAGNVGEAQDFTHIVETAKLLKLNQETDIRLIIIGNGRRKAWVDEQIKKFNLQDVLFMLGRFPINSMPSFFAQADVMLVSLKDELIFNLTVPAKIQAYMSASKPIIAMMNGEGASLIEESKCGLSVPAGAVKDLVGAIKRMKLMTDEERRKLGVNGNRYCNLYFKKNICLDNLYSLIVQDEL